MEIEVINMNRFNDFLRSNLVDHQSIKSHVNQLILTAYKGGIRYRLSEKETVTKQEEYIQFKSEVKHDKETEEDILTIIF